MSEIAPSRKFYAEARSRLWPVLLFKVDRRKNVAPQLECHRALLQKTARQLLKLPTTDIPKPLVKHVEDWAKLLQRQAAFHDEGLRHRFWEQPEDSTGSIISELLKAFFGSPKAPPGEKPGLARFQKGAITLSNEVERMEAILERLGIEHIEGYDPRDYAWYTLWVGSDEDEPRASGMGVADGVLRDLLGRLPGGRQVSNLYLHTNSHDRLSICGSPAEGFAFQRLNLSGSGYEYSKAGGCPLDECAKFAGSFLSGDEEWDEGIEWTPDEEGESA